MPELPRDDHELPIDPWTLEGLLADERPSVDAAVPGTAALADLVSAARGPARADELVGEDAALAAFVSARDSAASSTSTRHRRTSVLSTLIGSKLALAAAAGAVTLGGVSAAAFTGSLPDGAQGLAHQVIGAPAATGDDTTDVDEATDEPTDEATDTATETAEPTGSATATPVGPNATGPAAFGLCTAYTAQMRSGHTPDPSSVAFRNLAAAAGGEANIATYCATIAHPGSATARPTGAPTSHPDSTNRPTKAPSTHPTGSPTTHPGGDEPTEPADQTRPTDSPTQRGSR